MATILFITNDLETVRIWSFILQDKGVTVVAAGTIDKAIHECEQQPFDLVLIEWEADAAAALDICEQLRTYIINPIIMLTENQQESWLLAAYAAGADECIVKPTSMRLLQAKLMVWLRRAWNVPTEVLDTLQAGQFRLDPASRLLKIGADTEVRLTNLEFRLLHLLLSNQERPFTSEQIVTRVWGHAGAGDTTMLKHVVYRLRRKLEPDPAEPRHLINRPGSGYAFYP